MHTYVLFNKEQGWISTFMREKTADTASCNNLYNYSSKCNSAYCISKSIVFYV